LSTQASLIDATHDPALESWVESANDPATDFPIQNLPFGRFHDKASGSWRIGVAIGDQLLDLQQAQFVHHDDTNSLMRAGPAARKLLRGRLSEALARGSSEQTRLQRCLMPQADVQMDLPCQIGAYTDFYAGIHHATAVGKLFRPDNPLLPNYKWVPIGYHGRASSIGVSGESFPRPLGQSMPSNAVVPVVGPSKRLDYELEVAVFVGTSNIRGEPVPIERAEDHIFGFGLLNDWSARDIQAWEYQPLGPFLSKNFATTVSPWIVTLEALAPFRAPLARRAGDPALLAYLDSQFNRDAGAFDVTLEVWLQTARMRAADYAGDGLSVSSFRDAYWTAAQMVAHHTMGGCNLQSGDLLGSGTLSGPYARQGGSLLELTAAGTNPLTLSNGEQRTFVEDGDTVVMRGSCERAGYRRIGFGECRGTVLPAHQSFKT